MTISSVNNWVWSVSTKTPFFSRERERERKREREREKQHYTCNNYKKVVLMSTIHVVLLSDARYQVLDVYTNAHIYTRMYMYMYMHVM